MSEQKFAPEVREIAEVPHYAKEKESKLPELPLLAASPFILKGPMDSGKAAGIKRNGRIKPSD